MQIADKNIAVVSVFVTDNRLQIQVPVMAPFSQLAVEMTAV